MLLASLHSYCSCSCTVFVSHWLWYTRYASCVAAVLMALTAYKGSFVLLGIPNMKAAPLLCWWLWQFTKAAGRCRVYRICQLCRCCADGFEGLQRQLCAAGYTGNDSCAAAVLQAVNRSKGSWCSRHCLKFKNQNDVQLIHNKCYRWSNIL